MRISSLIGTLTIPISQDKSNIIQGKELANLVALLFYNVAAYTGTVAVEVAYPDDALEAAHQALTVDGTAVELVAATTQLVNCGGFRSIMLDSDGTEGAARAVQVVGIFDIRD